MSATAKTAGDGVEAIRARIGSLRRDVARLMELVRSGAFRDVAAPFEPKSDEPRRIYDPIERQVEEQPLTSPIVASTLGVIGGRLIH